MVQHSQELAEKDRFHTIHESSAVGRNVAILHQKTPKGIDPEATSSMGIQQGLERGFNLPTSSYGFDFKITF